jgi:hypothetical protein
VNRNDPLTEMIAKKIIEIGQTGVKEPAQISEIAIKTLGLHRPFRSCPIPTDEFGVPLQGHPLREVWLIYLDQVNNSAGRQSLP